MPLSFTIYVAEREREREREGEGIFGHALIYSYKRKYSKLTVLDLSVLTTRKELKSIPKTSWTFFTLSEFTEEHYPCCLVLLYLMCNWSFSIVDIQLIPSVF